MSWENTVVGEIAQVATQTTDTTITVGGRSLTGTETSILSPLSGHVIWDSCAYFLTGVQAIGGSWTVEVQGTIAGITQLPLARKVVDATIVTASPAGNSAIVIESTCNSPCSLVPTQVLFDNTVAGGITATVSVIAKSKRGQLPGGTLNPQHVNLGVLASIPLTAGRWGGANSGISGGITQDTTIALQNTTRAGTTNFFTYGGLDRNTMWDSVLYFMDVSGASGTWNVYVRGVVNGNTVVIAGASGIGAGTTVLGITKIAFKNSTFGCGVKPTNFLFDVTTSGVSQSISGTIVYAAKTSKGRRLGR